MLIFYSENVEHLAECDVVVQILSSFMHKHAFIMKLLENVCGFNRIWGLSQELSGTNFVCDNESLQAKFS